MRMHTILLAESDAKTISPYRLLLEEQGFETILAEQPEEIARIMESEHIDLLVTGLKAPTSDDTTLIRVFHEHHSEVPIMVLSDLDDLTTKIRIYSAGADEYLTFSVSPAEVLLHVKALLRRCRITCEHQLRFPHSVLDYDRLSVCVDETETLLPLKEFLLLFKLVSYPGKIFSRDELLDEIWGKDSSSVTQTVDVHVSRLRKRFHDNPDFAISTVRGAGYRAELKYRA